jgi:tRNA (guanine37-N1)-methyltransferase
VRIDIVSIFPQFFDVLNISLLGKAQANGLIDLTVHDLRNFTEDRHRTVDDTPYGGGAGMVMTPEPWGRAVDTVLTGADNPLIIFPSPAGHVFSQQMAHNIARETHVIFGCGRYEGIDQRVFDYATTQARVCLVSLGDYVLNGGEVAVLAIIEAVARLFPGVVGNPESLVNESHENGLLEYPSYTKPALWRGHHVPAVLLSGNHGEIERWRCEQQITRTRAVRPDLLPPANTKSTLSS